MAILHTCQDNTGACDEILDSFKRGNDEGKESVLFQSKQSLCFAWCLSDATQDHKGMEEYLVCKNVLCLLFNYGYKKLRKLKEDLKNASVAKHGLCGKVSNHIKNFQEQYADIHCLFDKLFTRLEEEAKHHATIIVQEKTGVGLQDTKVKDIFLPSLYTKCQLCYNWLYMCGYIVKANAKGNTPHLKDFQVREFDRYNWPAEVFPYLYAQGRTFKSTERPSTNIHRYNSHHMIPATNVL